MVSLFRTHITLLSALVALAACGTQLPEGSLVIPRGATISVRTIEAITTSGGEDGTPFQTALETPLATDSTVFVPAGAVVEGIARAQSDDSSAEVELRLTRIQMSGSSDLNIETVPMNRSAASVTTSDTTIEATAGLREKIRYLAELDDNSADSQSPDTALGAVVPSGAQLVFTLSEKIVIVPSS